jgi:glycosyltransferase involved in cell wall biosynthesis
VHIAIVLPRGHRFAPDTSSSICTCAHDFARTASSAVRVTVLGSQCDAPFGGMTFVGLAETGRLAAVAKRRAYAQSAARTLAEIKPDVVLVELDGWLGAFVAAQRPGAAPVALRLHIDAEKTLTGVKGWRRRRRFRYVDGLISVSPAMNAIIQASMGGQPPSIAAANGIDLDLWRGADDASREKRIVFAGRLVPEKGIVPMCEAVRDFLSRAANGDWRATFLVTDVAKKPELEQQCLAILAPVAGKFDWRTNRSRAEVQATMKSASIVVVPSIMIEGFGMVAAEAHAAGCAVISSGTGGLRDASQSAAYYLDAVTPNDIVTALQRVSQPSALDDWRARSTVHAEANLSLSKTAAMIETFLRQLTQNSGQTSGTED